MTNRLCPNCKTPLDPKKTEEYHREVYYCATDETGRISVACSMIRGLTDRIYELSQALKELRGMAMTHESLIGGPYERSPEEIPEVELIDAVLDTSRN